MVDDDDDVERKWLVRVTQDREFYFLFYHSLYILILKALRVEHINHEIIILRLKYKLSSRLVG